MHQNTAICEDFILEFFLFGRLANQLNVTPVRGICNIWNQSAGGLVWIYNSAPFGPLKSSGGFSITACHHLGLQKKNPQKKNTGSGDVAI